MIKQLVYLLKYYQKLVFDTCISSWIYDQLRIKENEFGTDEYMLEYMIKIIIKENDNSNRWISDNIVSSCKVI